MPHLHLQAADQPSSRRINPRQSRVVRLVGFSFPLCRRFLILPIHNNMSSHISNVRPPADTLLAQIADYVCAEPNFSDEAYETARYCLMDTLGCGILALQLRACTKLLGPVVPGTVVPNGARVPGTNYRTGSRHRGVQHRLHHSLAGFQRHLARGGMGSSFGQSRRHSRRDGLSHAARGKKKFTVRDILTAMIQGARNPRRARAGK